MQKCMGFFFVLAQARIHATSTKLQTLSQRSRVTGPACGGDGLGCINLFCK